MVENDTHTHSRTSTHGQGKRIDTFILSQIEILYRGKHVCIITHPNRKAERLKANTTGPSDRCNNKNNRKIKKKENGEKKRNKRE